MKQVNKLIKNYALYLAFIIVWSGTLGSLYFSEFLHLIPCKLCWYQRILMYPLVIIFGVAIARKDKNVAYYSIPLAVIGAIIAAYQYLLQMTPLSIGIESCSVEAPCSGIQILLLGFITIPFLSFVAFSFLIILMILLLKSKQ